MELELQGSKAYLSRMKIENSKKNDFNIGNKFLNKLTGGKINGKI